MTRKRAAKTVLRAVLDLWERGLIHANALATEEQFDEIDALITEAASIFRIDSCPLCGQLKPPIGVCACLPPEHPAADDEPAEE